MGKDRGRHHHTGVDGTEHVVPWEGCLICRWFVQQELTVSVLHVNYLRRRPGSPTLEDRAQKDQAARLRVSRGRRAEWLALLGWGTLQERLRAVCRGDRPQGQPQRGATVPTIAQRGLELLLATDLALGRCPRPES